MNVQRVDTIEGPAAPLLIDNIDTDVIIRIERLTSIANDELGPYAFEALRYDSEGRPKPDFVLHRPEFKSAAILLSGSNFGCGSSRENAVWAIMGLGIKCLIAPSFGEIFYSNCFQNGVLPIRLDRAEIAALSSQCNGGAPVRVNLRACEITAPDGMVFPFAIDDYRRQGLLQGLSDIEMTMQMRPQIEEWQVKDRTERPWIWELPG